MLCRPFIRSFLLKRLSPAESAQFPEDNKQFRGWKQDLDPPEISIHCCGSALRPSVTRSGPDSASPTHPGLHWATGSSPRGSQSPFLVCSLREGTEDTPGPRCVSASANCTRHPALTLPWFLLPPRATWAHSQPFHGLPRALVLRMPGPVVFRCFTVCPLPFCCPLLPGSSPG